MVEILKLVWLKFDQDLKFGSFSEAENLCNLKTDFFGKRTLSLGPLQQLNKCLIISEKPLLIIEASQHNILGKEILQ